MRRIISLADLVAASQDHIETEDDLSCLMHHASELAAERALQGLAFGLMLLADMPAERAASHMGDVTLLAGRVLADGPVICHAVAQALAQFAGE